MSNECLRLGRQLFSRSMNPLTCVGAQSAALLHIPPLRVMIALCCLIVICGCAPIVPATTPPQLQHTPGALIRIDDEQITTQDFSVNYPDGWRIIKNSPSVNVLTIVFAAPDDATLILLSETPLTASMLPPTDIPTVTASRTVTSDNQRVYLLGRTSIGDENQLQHWLEKIATSIHFIP